MTAWRSHPVPVARAAELRQWIDSGEYGRILGGDYPRRDDDGNASVTADVKAAAESYRQAFTDSQDPLMSLLRRLGDGAVRRWATGSGTGRRPGRERLDAPAPWRADPPAPAAAPDGRLRSVDMTLSETQLRAAVARELPGVRADLEGPGPHPGHRVRRLRPRPGRRSPPRRSPSCCAAAACPTCGSSGPAGSPPSSGAGRRRPARRPCCSTPTTTSSRSATGRPGSASRSSRSSATAASTGAAPPTTRPA